MKTISVIIPVLFLILAGMLARKKEWVSQAARDGAWNVIVTVFFPILIFSLMAKATVSIEDAGVVLYILACNLLIFAAGGFLTKKLTPDHAEVARFLLMTSEGGTIALPLYLSLVKSSSTTVIFDIAIVTINFIFVPLWIEKNSSRGQDRSLKTLLLSMIKNPFLISVVLGLLVNFSGLYTWIQSSIFANLYNNVIDMATGPITAVVLFCLGYSIHPRKETLKPVLKLAVAKTLLYALVILGFFIFFASRMMKPEFVLAVVIYFMSPTSFGLIASITPLFKKPDDEKFADTFASVYLIITLAVFIIAALVQAAL